MDENRRVTGLVIHSFAVAHAATAALLAQTVVGDEAALTFLTGSMIVAIVKINGKHWTIGKALKFLGVFAGKYLGTRGLVFVVKLIPGIGNAANAAVTFTVTEILGWATYMAVKDGVDFESMSKEERDTLWKKAQDLREQETRESEKLYNSMSAQDKGEYDAAIRELRDRNISEKRRDELTEKINIISRKYAS